MQYRQGQTIPESPRPVHDPYDMAPGTRPVDEHCFIHEASKERETDFKNSVCDAIYRAKHSGDQCKETRIPLLDVERISMILRQMHTVLLLFWQLPKVGI